MTYQEFIQSKKHSPGNYGITPNFIPDQMFDFQKYTVEYLIKKGRGAGFIDTGLGKTFDEMVIATNYIRHTNKPVLIITPLAVAFQFITESEKFGIDDISYSKDGKYKTKIVLCNYERLHHFDPADFDCVICDESSVLKDSEAETRKAVTSFLKSRQYRYLFTATPSPNDFIELGTSSEALGYLGYADMLSKFFTNKDKSLSPTSIGVEWILKGHAVDAFFQWVSSWSLSMRKPSDLGFDDTRHKLPPLNIEYHPVKNDKNMVINGQIQMFNADAKTLPEVREENKLTVEKRCQKAVELASAHDISVYWCNLNNEGDLLQKLDKSAYQIKGSMSLDKKEEILLAFARGEIKKLITKSKITGFGLNWQHCNHTVYFPDFSYEKWYQAVRRFWRFGQLRPVTVDMVHSDGQARVIKSLLAKSEKANELFSKLNANLHKNYEVKRTEFTQPVSLPSFLK